MAPPPGQACPIKSRKVPQLEHILRRKCPNWRTFYEESAPAGAHFAEKVPHQGQILRKMCPTSRNSYAFFAPHFLSAPPPSKFCIRPCTASLYDQLDSNLDSDYLKKKKVDSDPGGFGFKVPGFGFQMPRFARHCWTVEYTCSSRF